MKLLLIIQIYAIISFQGDDIEDLDTRWAGSMIYK